MERIVATYLIETPFDVSEAAAILAGEQSSGTFVAVPGETEALRQRFRARVDEIREEVPDSFSKHYEGPRFGFDPEIA